MPKISLEEARRTSTDSAYALGTLITKEKLVLSDVETVEQIKVGPYLYFIGLEEFQY